MAEEYFEYTGAPIYEYELKAEFQEVLERQRLLLKLADKRMWVTARYYSGTWPRRKKSLKPFRLIASSEYRHKRQSCFKTPEALAEAVQRIIEND